MGLALARPARALPPRLLARVQAIAPLGPRIAATSRGWERGGTLRWPEPGGLDRRATLEVNAALKDDGVLGPGSFEALERAPVSRRGIRAAPAALAGLAAVLGIAAAFFLFAGKGGDRPRPTGAAAIYRQHCAGCHGGTGTGDGLQARLTLLKVPDMTDPKRMAAFSDEYLYTVIAKGSAALGGTSGMPGWDHVLTPEEIRALVAHTRSLAVPPPAGR